MENYRPGPAVRLIARVLTVIWISGWVLTGVFVVGVGALELFAAPETRAGFSFGIPVSVDLSGTTLPAVWSGATGQMRLDDGAASLRVPLTLASGRFRAATFGAVFLQLAIVLLFVQQLRGVFRRAADGVPFDAGNAARLRWMGALLFAGHVAGSLLATWQAAVAVRMVQPPAVTVAPPVELDERLVFSFDERILLASLLLFAFAEIFRRGAALEHEQSLVV